MMIPITRFTTISFLQPFPLHWTFSRLLNLNLIIPLRAPSLIRFIRPGEDGFHKAATRCPPPFASLISSLRGKGLEPRISRRRWTAACPTCSWAVPTGEKQEKVASPRSFVCLYRYGFYPTFSQANSREWDDIVVAVGISVTFIAEACYRETWTRMRTVKSQVEQKRGARRKRIISHLWSYHISTRILFREIAVSCRVSHRRGGKKTGFDGFIIRGSDLQLLLSSRMNGNI